MSEPSPKNIIDKTIPMNIIFPIRGEEVLLAIKTRKIGVGMFNGYGGKLEAGETMLESCAKELQIESGLKANPEDFKKIAVIDFYVHKPDNTTVLHKCDIFTVEKWTGEPQSTEEMDNPTWFKISELPFSKMMPDTESWVNQVLTGKMDWNEFHSYQ